MLKKKIIRKEEWKQTVAKTQRQSGQDYVSKSTGLTVKGKTFSNIANCCLQKCYRQFSDEDQERLFFEFYDLGNKTAQDIFLSGCMSLSNTVTDSMPNKKNFK